VLVSHPPPGYWQGPGSGYWQGPGYGPPPPPQAPRPGSIPLRPLGLSDILDGTFRLIRRNPKVMLGLSAGFAVVQTLLVAIGQIVTYSALGRVSVTTTPDSTGTTNLGPLFGGEGLQLLALVVGTLLGAILTGMLTVAITEDIIGRILTVREVWTRVRRRIWPLIGLSVLVTLLEFLGLIPCLAPGVWLWGIWAVAVPALMVEGTTIRGALGRSRRLVSGTFWRVWGIRALGAVMAFFAGGLISGPFEIVGVITSGGLTGSTGGGLPVALIVLTAVGSILSATLTAPLKAGIDALLYVDLRMRKEGLDIVLQLNALRPGPAGAASIGPAGPIAGSAF
jgi:hypothetical protein